jgi:hypothetical protein
MISNSIMDFIATAPTLAEAEQRILKVDEVLLTENLVHGSTPDIFQHIHDMEDSSFDLSWHGVVPTVQRSGRDSAMRNPFHFPDMAARFKYWWNHLVLWCNHIIGDRTRNCNATSEVVNLVLKGNTLHGK